MRMKFIRSLPEMWASTRWPFSSSTENMVLGKGSSTVPSTSIASFFATCCVSSLSRTNAGHHGRHTNRQITKDGRIRQHAGAEAPALLRQHPRHSYGCEDHRTLLGHGNRVLEVSRGRMIPGHDRPVVRQSLDLGAAQRKHRLDGQAEAGLELPAATTAPEIGNLRLFVHLSSDAVADILTNDTVPAFDGNVLDRSGDVLDMGSGYCRCDARHQRQPSGRDKTCRLGRRRPHEERPSSVAVVTLPDRSGVHGDDLALFDDPFARDPMDNFVVDRDADARGEAQISLEGWPGPGLADVSFGEDIELTRGHARLERLFHQREHFGDDAAGMPHPLDLVA